MSAPPTSQEPSPASSQLTLSLPIPPSANALWRTWKGRTILTKRYRDWKSAAESDLARQRVGKLFKKTLLGPYQMTLEVDRPRAGKVDLSNRLKALEDALTQAGVIEDDHLAQRITLAWSNRKPGQGARVWVTLEPSS